jgi:hypothetical protein
MGVSKAMMEKVFVAKSRFSETYYNCRNQIWKCNGFKRVCDSIIFTLK